MITRASQFAKQAHAAIDQRRKYTLEPYIVHPAAVARLVTSVTDDEAMICAAWLHDVVEDTAVTIAQIEIEFNHDIASLVADLTDVSTPADGNREARKLIDLKHTQAASPRAKTVKLADLIDNSGSISLHDPRFARIYMAEKRRLLGALQQGDQRLFVMANEIVEAYYKD